MPDSDDQTLSIAHQRARRAQECVDQHWSAVYCIMYRLTNNTHDAEELTQEAFARAIEKLEQYHNGTSMRAWIVRIAMNHLIDGKRRMQPIIAGDDAPWDRQTSDHRQLSQLEVQERSKLIQSAINQLPQTQKIVLILRSMQEYSFEQVAEIIGTSEATARWHMMQARQHLIRILNGRV